MIARLGQRIAAVFRVIVPDPLVLAIGLTFLCAALAFAFGEFPGLASSSDGSPSFGDRGLALLDSWRGGGGLWKFLGFGMQMCLILLTGHALAESKPVRHVIDKIAGLAGSGRQGAAIVGLAATLTGFVNWGLGLIVGALIAREVARGLRRRGVAFHYPLLVAAGYTGLLVWHGGLSGSAPITSTSVDSLSKVFPKDLDEASLGGYVTTLGDTLGSVMNLVAAGGLLVLIPAVLVLLSPKDEASMEGMPAELAEPREAPEDPPAETFVEHLERSRIVVWLLVAALFAATARFVQVDGLGKLGPNEINAAMLGLGLLAHGSLRSYIRACGHAAGGCVGIIVQFPLYAGILGMLSASGLIGQVARGMASAADATTLPLFTMLSAGLVNLVVPSGGGQWGIQGPIAMEAGASLGVPNGKMILAVAYGDQLTNMLQPFWALPLLAITGAKARDIVGYTAILMIVCALWLSLCLLVF